MTFKEFLLQQEISDTFQGDFVADACEDEALPEVRSWLDLQSYVRDTADVSILQRIEDVAQAVWSAYESLLGHDPAIS